MIVHFAAISKSFMICVFYMPDLQPIPHIFLSRRGQKDALAPVLSVPSGTERQGGEEGLYGR